MGVICLAVPVDAGPDMNVAVSVSGPAGELSPERREDLLPVLRGVADDLAANGRFLSSLRATGGHRNRSEDASRSEEHTSELQSLMRISYAVFCLKKKKNKNTLTNDIKNARRGNKEIEKD